MLTRPQILFLTHRFPYPPNRGDRIRSFRLLEALSQTGDVDLLSLYDQTPPPEYLAVLNQICSKTGFIPWRPYGRWFKAAFSMAIGKSMTEGLFYSRRLYKKVRQWSREKEYDFVVAFCSSMYPYTCVPELVKAKRIVDLVDVDSQKWLDYASVCKLPWSSWKKLIFLTEGKRLRKKEIEIAQRSMKTLVVSPDEAQLYRSFCPDDARGKIVSISNGVDTDYFSPTGNFAHEPVLKRRCVFVGALDYRANLDGIDWFVSHVWSEIRERFPDLELDLVGSAPGEKARGFTRYSGVNLVGPVSDVRPYLQRSEAVIVPLRVARGIQNKVLEAMAMGKPVIASPMSLQGIEEEVSQYAWNCESPEEWTEGLTRVLSAYDSSSEKSTLQTRTEQGRNALVRLYPWPVRFEPIKELIGFSEYTPST